MQSFVVIGVVALALSNFDLPPPSEARVSNRQNNHVRASRSSSNNVEEERPRHVCNTFHSSDRSCQDFSSDLISRINNHIQVEFEASHTYLSMSQYFARDDVSHRGLAKFFRAMSQEERDHAIMFMDYLNKRGGYYTANRINEPVLTDADLETYLAAMEKALAMENDVSEKILDIHWAAQEIHDPHFQDYLESEFLTEQVDSVRQLSGYIAMLSRLADDPLAVHAFDEELYHDKR